MGFAMARKSIVQWIVCGLVAAAGGQASAQMESTAEPQYSQPSGSSEAFDYSAISPSEALHLNTPMRFKPIIGIEIGMISMHRAAPDSFTFIFDQGGAPLMNMNEMQGGAGNGLDSKLHLYNLFSDCKAIDVEMRYFQVSNMNFDQNVSATTPVIPVFFNAIPADPVNVNQVIYDSNIRSYEANLVARTPWRASLLGGFRYFEVAEDFVIWDNIAQPPEEVRSLTRNKMAGAQVGGELVAISNAHAKVWGSFKWAAMHNDVGGNAVAINPATDDFIVSILSGSTTTHLLDFELAGSLNITRSLSVYGGYQGLAAYGVGLVTSQSRESRIFLPTNPIVFDDTQWHGFKLGMVATF
jgi:hypothetical protein